MDTPQITQHHVPAAAPIRRPDGRWVAGGKSPNPGGRPQAVIDVAAAAREFTSQALAVLVAVMHDPAAPHNARVSAANSVLDRGWGRAPATISFDDGGKAEAQRQEILKTLADAARKAHETMGGMSVIQPSDAESI